MSDICERTTELLRRLKQQNDEDPDHGDQELLPADLEIPISTLAPGVTRQLSPMLRARFAFCSTWKNANLDQNWLSLEATRHALDNPEIKELVDLRIENWDWAPPASVNPEDCAIFSYNPYAVEETYLVWESEQEEPIVWRFFSAEYYKFADLNRFLEYLIGERMVDDSGRVTAEP